MSVQSGWLRASIDVDLELLDPAVVKVWDQLCRISERKIETFQLNLVESIGELVNLLVKVLVTQPREAVRQLLSCASLSNHLEVQGPCVSFVHSLLRVAGLVLIVVRICQVSVLSFLILSSPLFLLGVCQFWIF